MYSVFRANEVISMYMGYSTLTYKSEGFSYCILTRHENHGLDSKERRIERKQMKRLLDKQHVFPLRPQHTG